MSVRKLITTAVVTTSLVAGSAAGLATSAQAGDWRHDDGGYGQEHSNYRAWNGDRSTNQDWNRGRGPRNWDAGPRRDYDHDTRPAPAPQVVYKKKKDRTGRNIALGVGIVLLGAILAAEAGRGHGHR